MRRLAEILGVSKPPDKFAFLLYATTLLVAFLLSQFVAYKYLVYASIGMGFVVSGLLVLNAHLTYRSKSANLFFFTGIVLMLLGLVQSAFQIRFRPWLLSIRDISLFFSGAFSLTYLLLVVSRKYTSTRGKLRHYRDFVSIFNTTLADELCSCLNFQSTVASVFGMLGIGVLFSTQIQFGFLLMVIMLVYQLRISCSCFASKKIDLIQQTSEESLILYVCGAYDFLEGSERLQFFGSRARTLNL